MERQTRLFENQLKVWFYMLVPIESIIIKKGNQMTESTMCTQKALCKNYSYKLICSYLGRSSEPV